LRVSVVTPTHNKVELLERTLRSLDHQDLPWSDYEVVVVDDGSTDATPEFLRQYRPNHGWKTVRQEQNRGRAASRNRGLVLAQGELIVFLDDDMDLATGFLRAHRDFHEAHPHSAGVGNVIMHPDLHVAPIDRYMSTRGAQKIQDRGPLPWKYFSTNNASVRRDDLLAIGGFDERFVYYGFEDLELAWRLEKERRIKFGYVAGARSLHIHAHSLDDVLAKKTLCGRSSLRYLFEKHPEIRRELGYERFDPVKAGDPAGLNVKRVMYRVAFTRPVYALMKGLAGLSLGPITDKALDYLVQYHYLAGLKEPRLAAPREARSA
jgi:glycosyltransferase involved in cell wall biosynthesis